MAPKQKLHRQSAIIKLSLRTQIFMKNNRGAIKYSQITISSILLLDFLHCSLMSYVRRSLG